MRCPYSLYKKQTKKGLVWYARFWDAKAGRYAAKRSTGVMAEGKRERRREAEAKAREMLAEIRFDTEVADTPFVEYVENFWKPDSPYVKECAMTRKTSINTPTNCCLSIAYSQY